MTTLADFYAFLKTLCDELFTLRLSPRPSDADWRYDRLSRDDARAQREKCRQTVDACLAAMEAGAGQFPDTWRGDDPQQSKYIRLKRSLGMVGYWLHEFQRPFRGFKMPMDSDAQDQHDDPADVKSWNDAEGDIRRLSDELKDYIDLHAANAASAAAKSTAVAATGENLVRCVKAYLAHLEGGGDLSFGLEKRVNEAAIHLGLPAPFSREEGTGENAKSLYVGYNDSVGEEAGLFQVINHRHVPVPLDNENRAKIVATLRNLLIEAEIRAAAIGVARHAGATALVQATPPAVPRPADPAPQAPPQPTAGNATMSTQPAATAANGGAVDGDARFYPAAHYKAKYGIPPDRLRQATKRGSIRTRTVRQTPQYLYEDVKRTWPEDVADEP